MIEKLYEENATGKMCNANIFGNRAEKTAQQFAALFWVTNI